MRFNVLLETCRITLGLLRRAIKGLVVMSEDLDDMLSSLHNHQVRDVCVGERESVCERKCVCLLRRGVKWFCVLSEDLDDMLLSLHNYGVAAISRLLKIIRFFGEYRSLL